MKRLIYSLATSLVLSQFNAQEATENKDIPKNKDTTKYKFGKLNVFVFEDLNSEDTRLTDEDFKNNKGHWAGLDFGVNVLLNNQLKTNFEKTPYWENNPSTSFNINLNLFEKKFTIYKNYIGITTGLGFNFAQYGFKNNYVLASNKDSVFATIDTVYNYSKNKLKASYLQIPLLLEFNSHATSHKSFYLSAGVVGGLRLSSKVKREGEWEGKNFEQKMKGVYSLNSFKLDATVRVGYHNFGAFATYALVPLFEQGKTVDVHPVSIGLTFGF